MISGLLGGPSRFRLLLMRREIESASHCLGSCRANRPSRQGRPVLWFLQWHTKGPPAVRIAGRVYEPGRPTFNVAGSFQPEDVVVETVQSKVSKSYRTPHPIELLAHFGALARGESARWNNHLSEALLAQGLGPFRRVWVLGWEAFDLSIRLFGMILAQMSRPLVTLLFQCCAEKPCELVAPNY